MAQPNEKMNYKLLLMLIVPAVIVFGIFIYVNSKGSEQVQQSTNEIPIPEATKDDVPTSKKTAYQELKERQLKELEAKGRGSQVESDDFMELATSDGVEEEKKEYQAPAEEVPEEPKRSVRKRNPIKTEEPVEQPKEEVKVVVQEKPAEVKRGGLGIVRSGNGSEGGSVAKSASASKEGKRYFPVILDESVTIKNNSSVVFLLLDDVNLGDVVVKKNSYLFGKARDNGVAFDVLIEEIKNTDGKVIGVKDRNIFIYDEKYSKGLAHEGKLNEAVNESAGESGSDAVGSIRTSNQTATQALRALDKTVGAIARKKETTISLSKGYKVFVKME